MAVGIILEQIRNALGNLRGHRDFIKSAHMPPCDYVITDPPFIVEFDESQHFSQPRLITLANYPENFPVGFSRPRWQELCRSINAKDDMPVDRDERRAWYDTLRDLVPVNYGFTPTVRLYAEAYEWCALTVSEPDLATFRGLLDNRLPEKSSNFARSP